jgi:hypothetical protein
LHFNDPEVGLQDRVVTMATPEGLLKSLSSEKSCLLVFDEMHTFFNQCGCQSKVIKPLACQLLSVFGNTPVIKKTSTSDAMVTVYKPKVNFLGNIQTKLLRQIIKESPNHLESGFFTRFQFHIVAGSLLLP